MACWGVIFDTGSAKWLAGPDKWVSSKDNAIKIVPSELASAIKAYGAEWMIKKGTLQYHLEDM